MKQPFLFTQWEESVMAKGRRSGRQFKRFFTSDDCAHTQWVEIKRAWMAITFILKYSDELFAAAARGVPWKCLLAIGIKLAAEDNPRLFPHPVLGPYVEGMKVFILSRVSTKRRTEYPLAITYRHNFTKQLRQFDTITKSQFKELWGDQGVEIRLKVPVRQAAGGMQAASRPQPSRAPTEAEAAAEPRQLKGAQRRAKDAGLLGPGVMGADEPRPAA